MLFFVVYNMSLVSSLFIAAGRLTFDNSAVAMAAAVKRGVRGSSLEVSLVECRFSIGC